MNRDAAARKLEQLLLDLVDSNASIASSALADLTKDEWSALVALASLKRVRPLVYERLAEPAIAAHVPDAVAKQAREAQRRMAAKLLDLHAECDAVSAALNAAGIRVIKLKGAFLGPVVYGSPSRREMIDLDLLVERHELARAVDVLLARGYAGVVPFSVEADAEFEHHVTRLKRSANQLVELHWALIPPGRSIAADPAPLWHRARPISPDRPGVMALSPEDAVLHICVHAVYLHDLELSLVPFCDLQRMLERFEHELRWPELIARAREHGWSRGVGLVLSLARSMTHARVPVEVIRALCPSGVDDILPTADRLIWSERGEPAQFRAALSKLAAPDPWWTRLRYAASRVTLPQRHLRAMYGQDGADRSYAALLIRRVRDLLARHGRSAGRLFLRRGETLVATAERRNDIQAWLERRP